MRSFFTLLVFLLILGSAMLIPKSQVSADESDPPIIVRVSPENGEMIWNRTPIITAEYIDVSMIDRKSVSIEFDGNDVTDWETTSVKEDHVSYSVPSILRLNQGNHTVYVEVADVLGNKASKEWTFFVNTSAPPTPQQRIDIGQIVIILLIGMGMGGMGFVGYIMYLRRKKNFTFEKYFIQHPSTKGYLVIYLPIIIAIVAVLLSYLYISNLTDPYAFSYEIIFVIGFVIGIGPYAFYAQVDKRRTRQYERAFAQFLFELADAMRGGIDPAKAILELQKTDTGIMSSRLKIAAAGIRIGRPFEEMLMAMVQPMKSELIKRYASLIGESSKMGGETSLVVHRAAKDMDDSIKIEEDRYRQLTSHAVILYMAFVILLVVIFQLISIYPSISSINIGVLETAGDPDALPTSGSSIGLLTLKQRFLHLSIVNSIGAGILVGMFTDGRAKYGLMHAIILTLVAVIFFVVMIL
jgi:archaellum biogenesis protein FlaJ (TadC family)